MKKIKITWVCTKSQRFLFEDLILSCAKKIKNHICCQEVNKYVRTCISMLFICKFIKSTVKNIQRWIILAPKYNNRIKPINI